MNQKGKASGHRVILTVIVRTRPCGQGWQGSTYRTRTGIRSGDFECNRDVTTAIPSSVPIGKSARFIQVDTGRMILFWAGPMNSEFDRKSARFAFHIATSLCAVFLLTPATVTAAQTKDYPQPSKSMLGQISGRVYRSDTGEPVPQAQVKLYPADPDTAKAVGPERIVRTGPDGTFVFPDLPAGTFGISVWRNGFSEFSPQDDEHGRFITLKPGEKLESLVLRLHPTGVIVGQVSDEDGEAVQGLEAFALRINFQPGGRKQVSASAQTVTDDLGNFRMPNLPPGSYYVSAGGLIQHPMEAVG